MNEVARIALTAAAVASMSLGGIMAVAAEPGATRLYLKGAAYPESHLSSDGPAAETVKNLDRLRDDDPGLTIESGGAGRREYDDARYQDFLVAAPGARVEGRAELSLWVAPAGFRSDGSVTMSSYLFDCNEFGFGCEDLAEGSTTVHWTGGGSDFVEVPITIPLESHTFLADRVLKLRITAETSDGAAIWLAYDALQTPSAITFESFATPMTTTTTTTTTHPPITSTTSPAVTHPSVLATSTSAPTTPTAPSTTTTTTTTTSSTTTFAGPTTPTNPPPPLAPDDPFVADLAYVPMPGVDTNPESSIRITSFMIGWLATIVRSTWPWMLALVVAGASITRSRGGLAPRRP